MEKQNELLEFAEKYAYGFDAREKRFKHLELYDYQKEMLVAFQENKYNIIKQSRQMGIDIVMAIYVAYYVLKNEKKAVVITSDGLDCSYNLLDKIKAIIIYSGEKLASNSKKIIGLKNESKIYIVSGPVIGGRHANLTIINNFEFLPQPEGTMSTCAICTNEMIIASMPRYEKNPFYNLWTAASKGENDYNPISVVWNQNPNYNKSWYQEQCKQLAWNEDSIKNELDGEFVKKKDKKKKSAVSIRLKNDVKAKILEKMKQKEISSITDYIMELINKDLDS